MTRTERKLHYARQNQRHMTLCGSTINRIGPDGKLVNKRKVTSDPHAITCGLCKNHPSLDGVLGIMTYPGH